MLICVIMVMRIIVVTLPLTVCGSHYIYFTRMILLLHIAVSVIITIAIKCIQHSLLLAYQLYSAIVDFIIT